MADYKNIDEYILDQPQKTQEALFILKGCILKAAPDAEELFNYNIPAFTLVENGKRDQQIMIAGYKNHVGLYPHPSTIEKFSQRLSEYQQGKGSIQFPLDKPIPCDLIMEMVLYRKKMIMESQP